jgi:hypothetical protein
MKKKNILLISSLLIILIFTLAIAIVLLNLGFNKAFNYPKNILQTDNIPIASDNNLIVLISMDGVGLDLIGNDTPFLTTLLNEEGTTYSEEAKTLTQSETLPSHISMVTGLTLEHHNFHDNFITPLTPTMTWESIFDIALMQGYDYRAFVTKNKLSYLLGSKQDNRLKIEEENSSDILNDIDDFVEPNNSDMLVFIHFRDADRIGHESGWGSVEQRRAIETLDNNIRTMVNDLDTEFYSYNRYYIFTADHGGEGLNHSSGCPTCRAIPLIIHSSKEENIYPLPESEYNIYDIACIITKLMGADIPEVMDCKP